MANAKIWLDKLFNLGHKEYFDDFDRTSNILINQIQLIICAFLVMFTLKDLYVGSADYLMTIAILIVMLSFFFVRKKITLLAAVSFQITTCLIATTIEYLTHNLELRVEPFFLVILFFTVLFLPSRKGKYLFSGLVLVCFLAVIFSYDKHETSFQPNVTETDNVLIFIFASLMVFVITRRYFHLLKRILGDQANLLAVLKSKNTELERFAYITSHDLKQPIRNIGSFAGLLKKSINTIGKEEKNLEYLNEIESSASRMNTLIDEILSFSKINKVSFDKEQVDLGVLVTEYIKSHANYLNEKNATINFDKLPIVEGNKIYLSLLFQNLIENGIKYNNSDKPVISIFSKPRGQDIKITFEDNGIGISDEFSHTIFEPFKRLHSTRKYEGTGLGLSICRKIVESHDGKIWLESEKIRRGSRFAFTLPDS